MTTQEREFSHRFTVQATLEQVAAFHSDSRALRRLTPPPVIVQFNHVEPLGEGSLADFTMWMGPIPVRWVAKHTQFNPLHGFTDTQVSGPFTLWVHRHSFQSMDDRRTSVIDEVKATPGPGIISGLISRFIWLNLRIMFAYRAWVTRRLVEKSGGI